MAIDILRDETDAYDKPIYPYLGVSERNKIVLFTSYGSGVVLITTDEGPDNDEVGEYSTCWDETKFVPFHGTLTITNKL